jgi:NDP-sugar pyrophosphorylase family protein
VEAIVMAAGEGRRLRPITERWPKAVLPIDGRPVVVTLLHELADAGVGTATVVTGHLAERVEALAAECEPRLTVRFARQPEPLGSADAVRKALAAGARAPLLITAADTVYTPGDVGRFARAVESPARARARFGSRTGGSPGSRRPDRLRTQPRRSGPRPRRCWRFSRTFRARRSS